MSGNSEPKPNKKTQKFHQEIQNEIKSLWHVIRSQKVVIDDSLTERFFKIYNKLSYNINLLTPNQKKGYYSEIALQRKLVIIYNSPVTEKHIINKSIPFLNEYITASKADCQTIEIYRNCIQRLAQEYDLSKITVSTNDSITNGKNIAQLYDDAYFFKKRGKKGEADACLKQIQKFLDRQAFLYWRTLDDSYFNLIATNEYKIQEKYKDIRKRLLSGLTLYRPNDNNFLKEKHQYFLDLITTNHTDEFIESYNLVKQNPFNIVTNSCFCIIARLLQSNISSLDKNRIKESCLNDDIIFLEGFIEAIDDFTLDDTSFFERTSLEQEKPIIVSHPDHPEKGKPVIAAHSGHPEKGKPRIVDHGEVPETSLKDQAADRSQEQEDIKDMFVLPPSEALKDKTLSETLLAYGFIKAIPVLKKSTVYLLSRSFTSLERFLGSYLPKLSFSTVAPLRRTKSSAYFKEAPLNRSNIASDSDSKKLKPRTRTIVNKKTVSVTKKAFTAKGGFILTCVTVGLETLHARLKNAGYKRAAFFIPVASNFRPWGEAYFSTADYDLGIDPSAGYSTTRLFTHIADGTSYVFEGFSNIVYTAGEVEKFVYRLILSEKATGFDTGHLGVVNGLSEAIGSFIDSMGGNLEIRRAKDLAEFRSNISSYETPLGKKIRVKKLCIDRGLSHLPKEKTPMERIKKISGTYTQTESKVAQSLLHDYMPSETGNSILNIKTDHLNKDPFKVKKELKTNSCLKRYVEGKLYKSNLPKSEMLFSK